MCPPCYWTPCPASRGLVSLPVSLLVSVCCMVFPASRGLVSLLSLLVSLVVGCCVHLPEPLSSFLSPFFSLCLSPFLFPFVGCCFRLLEALCDLSSFLYPFLFPVVGCCIRALEALSLLSPFLFHFVVCCVHLPKAFSPLPPPLLVLDTVFAFWSPF